jgi:hypothetical protein
MTNYIYENVNFQPRKSWIKRGSKTYQANGAREVARRLKQIIEGKLQIG